MALGFVLCPAPLVPVGLVLAAFRPTTLQEMFVKFTVKKKLQKTVKLKTVYISVVDTLNYPKLTNGAEL